MCDTHSCKPGGNTILIAAAATNQMYVIALFSCQIFVIRFSLTSCADAAVTTFSWLNLTKSHFARN